MKTDYILLRDKQGKEKRIVRGDMSDSEWSSVVTKAQAHPDFAEYKQSGALDSLAKAAKDTFSDSPRVETGTEKGKAAIAKVKESHVVSAKSDEGKGLLDSIAKVAKSAFSDGPKVETGTEKGREAVAKTKGPQGQMVTDPTRAAEIDATTRPARVLQATSEGQMVTDPARAAEIDANARLDAESRRATSEGQMVTDPARAAEIDATARPVESPINFDQGGVAVPQDVPSFGEVGQRVERGISSPQATPPPQLGEGPVGQMLAETRLPDNAAQSLPSADSSSGSVSAKSSRPGAVPPAQQMPKPPDAMDQAFADQMTAARLRGEEEAKAAKATAAAREQAFNAMLDADKRRVVAENRMAETMQQHTNAMADLQSKVMEAGNMRVDPGRYWANKDSGQKAAAVIAGALFGFTGQGMQWLQRLDSLVEQDIRAQQFDISTKRDSLSEAVGIQGTILEEARRAGISDIAAANAAKSSLYANLGAQLDSIAANAAASDPMIAASAMEKKAALMEKQQMYANAALKQAHEVAIDNAQIAQGWAKINQDKMESQMRWGESARAGKEKAIQDTAGERKDMAELLANGESIKRMWSDYKRLGGKDKSSVVTSKLGLGMNATDAAQWENIYRPQYGMQNAKAIEDRVNDADRPFYIDKYTPSMSETYEAASRKVQAATSMAVSQYAARYNAMSRKGVDMSRFPTPEEYGKRILPPDLSGAKVSGERK